MKRTTTISTTRRAAMMLLMMLLTTMTAWGQEAIDGLTYNSTGGYYEINDEQDLIDLATYVYKNYSNGKTFKQTQPITMSGGNFTPIGSGYPFRHTYDGNGYAISGLIVNGNYNCAGLFGHVSSGTLRNVILLSPIVTSTKASSDDIYCGALAGSCYNTTVENCHFVSPTVSATNTGSGAKHLGALFGEFTGGSTATNCYFYGGNQSNVNGLGTYNTMTNVASTDYTAKLPDGVTATGSGFITGGTGYFVGGSTVNLPAAPVGYIYTYTVEGSPIDGTSFTINADVTVALSRTPNPADFSVNDAGTEYTIHTAVGWDVFCDLLAENDKGYFDGKTVKLGADIGTADEPVTRMAGTSGHEFTGTFDGDVKMLTFSAAAADNYVAPFYGVQGTSAAHAVIKDLNVVTTITANDYRHVAGLVAVTKGYVDISGCNATVNISATVGENNKSDLYPSGLVSQAAKLSGNGKITVSHCSVSGTITTDGKYAAGLVGITQCEAAVTDCRSSVTINSSTAIVDNDNNVNHDGSHGGLIGCTSSGTVTIEGCLFNGRLLSNNGTNNCGGFVGWRNTGLEIHNSLFDPVEVNIEKEGSATFVRNNVDTYNCYYTYLLNDDSHYKPQYDESSSVWRNGRAPRTVIGGENVTVSNIALTGEETEYNVSGITAYSGGGLKRTVSNETTLYYGSDDQVSLTLSADTPPEGYGFGGYTASPDGTTLTEDGDNYTLTMPDADVTISVAFSPIEYSITYHLEGGHLPTGQSNPATYTVETETFTLVNPERDGYAFAGWTGTGLNGATKTVTITQGTTTGNRDYTATWTLLPVSYIDADGIERTVVATPLAYKDKWGDWNLTTTTLTAGQWYCVNSDYGISDDDRITVSGSGAANIILCDGKIFSYGSRGITGNITIYGQSAGTGKMEIYGQNGFTDTETQYANAIDGEFTIYGGNVEVEGGSGYEDSGAAIYPRGAIGGTVNLYGGSLKATGTDAKADYGELGVSNFYFTHSTNGITGTVNFYGGTLNAYGGKHDSEYEVGDGNYDSNGINGTVNLSWDRSSDRFYADSYNGTVNVADGYTFLTNNNASVSGNGISGSTLNGKTLRPDTNSALHDDGDNRYTILTGAGWNLFCNMVKDGETFSGKTVYLGSDITASNIAGNATHKFQGEFDGQGNTVSGLNVYRGGTDPDVDSYVGLFAYLGSGANVHHVNLANSSFTGRNYIGGIAGHQDGGTVSYCTVASTVSINDAVIGTNQAPNNYHGGIVGYLYNGTVSHCVSSATLTVVDASSNSLGYGAIVGLNVNGSITDNLAIGATIPSSAKSSMAVIVGNRIGGVLQRNYYTNCTVRGVANATGVGHFATGAKPNLSDLTENDGAVPALRDGADNSTALALMAAVPEKFGTYSVSLNGRTLSKSGEWNTLCLPFGINNFSGTPLEGATVKELDVTGTYSGHKTGLDGTTLYLYFQDATSIKAGKPYIVKWQGASGSVSDPVFSGVTVSSTTPTAVTSYDKKVTFVGQYSPFSIGDTSIGTFDGDINEIIMLGTGSKLGYSKSARTLRSFRCHFYVPAEGSEPGARAFVLDFDGETTEIISPAEIKEITEMAGAWYSLDGRKLDAKPTKKGLYIHNGNKVVIK